MRSVLLISIVFPPEGGGGTVRAAKLAKYLPASGWRPVVLTTQPPPDPPVKAASMDDRVRVYRAPRVDVAAWLASARRLLRRKRGARGTAQPAGEAAVPRRRLADYVLVPDSFVGWAPLAALKGVWAAMREGVSVVYSTAPSPTTHLVGWFLKAILRRPWIVEFRDPWITNPFRVPRPFAWMERIERRLERAVLRRADHVVVTSAEYAEDFLARDAALPREKFTYIPNGYDPEDFEQIPHRSFERWTIVHTGNFYEARSARPFLEAVQKVVSERPELRREIGVVLVGAADAETVDAVRSLRLDDIVTLAGPVTPAESIAYMLGADALLLVPGPGRGTMPGKTYEYLAAGKPILATAGEGVVRDLVEETGTGIVTDADDREGIARALVTLFDRRGAAATGEHARAAEKFDRRNIARSTAVVLQNLADRQRPS